MRPSRKKLSIAAAAVLAGSSVSGCATTDYVDEQIALVNQRIDGVEAKANDGIQRADAVNAAAQAAGAQAQTANQRLDQLTPRVDSLEQRMTAKPPRN